MRCPLFLFFLFVLGFNLISQPNPYPVQKQWKLVQLEQAYLNCGDYFPVLTDEFEGNGLDTDLWATTLYASTGPNLYNRLHTNESECIYLDQNVSVSNGAAKLTARDEVASWQGVTRDVTCGTIWSKNKFNLGKYEIRCKLPPTKFWAAFWMWHGDEIDIIDVRLINIPLLLRLQGGKIPPVPNGGFRKQSKTQEAAGIFLHSNGLLFG